MPIRSDAPGWRRLLRRAWHDLGRAVQCLTWGVASGCADREGLARATLYFPLVGGVIGVVLVPVARLAGDTAGAAGRAALTVLALTLVSRGRWLSALADAVQVPAGRRRAGTRGARGAAAVGAIVAAKAIGFAAAGGLADLALLLAPVLGRWAPVVLLHGARPVHARESDGLATGRVTAAQFGWASVSAFAIALAAAEAVGLVAVVSAALIATALRLSAYARTGYMTAALAGASIEIVETATVLVVAGIALLANVGSL